jgi:lysophospholipase L1-like esterase
MKKTLIFVLLVSMFLVSCFTVADKQAHASTGVLPLVSLNAPAYASSQKYSSVGAKYADDATYDTYWRSSGATPVWLAYDLSGAHLSGNALVVWYNTATGTYDTSLTGEKAYNIPGTYEIDGNAAPGGTLPTSGWTTLASVSGNTYHSRQSIVNMAGYNWIRIYVTAVDGSTSNMDAAINMDVYDASSVNAPLPDDFIFYGDSITRSSMAQTSANGVGSFASLIAAKNAGHWPVEEDGGIGGYKTSDGVAHLPTWLSIFPGSYITLNLGTNDALGGTTQAAVYANFNTMVQDALAAGVTPIIPTIPWGPNSNIQKYGPVVNAAIEQIYAAYPTQVIVGPDLWNTFLNQTQLFGTDGIHPNSAGQGVYRQAYACSIDASIYGVSC